MDQLMNALMERNLVAWGIVVLVLVLFLKLLQSVGKGLFILLVIGIVTLVLLKFFPGVMAPVSDFIGGSWMGN
ncbi:MAG: hypothetical protein HRT56_03070 [Coraliomargarita sp.]|nr:hypothetical protein [Coraliomargarita sp.]